MDNEGSDMTVCDQTDVQQDCGCGCGADKAQPASSSVSKGDGRSTGRDPAPLDGNCRRIGADSREEARRRALEWLAANGLT